MNPSNRFAPTGSSRKPSVWKAPSSIWIRQRIDAKGAELRDASSKLSVRLLQRTEAAITVYQSYFCCDIDTFVMDNSDTRKEDVGRTYPSVNGYTPMAGSESTSKSMSPP